MKTVSSRALPERIVIVAGMPRGGTTYLYHALQSHPEIYVPFRKELHYFFFNRHRGDEWYHDFFRDIKPGQIGFDISPAYFMDSRCLEHLLEYNPDAKVILSLRDPVDWSLSMYSMINTFKFNMPPFAEFIEYYDHRIAYTDFPFKLTENHVMRTLHQYQEALGDNLLIYDFRLLREDLTAVMQAIERFVGLTPYFTEETIDRSMINASARKNIKLLYWFISREWFVNGLGRIFPHELLRKVRDKYDVLVSSKVSKSGPDLHSEVNRRLAEEKFADQRAEIQRLFVKHRIQLGSGKPFD